jgi:pimeloyl-ACP methyl ester carboxylesterase
MKGAKNFLARMSRKVRGMTRTEAAAGGSKDRHGNKKRKSGRIVQYLSCILIGIMMVLVAGGIVSRYFVYTAPFTAPDGKILPGSIAEFTRVKLGGYSQAILIRGKNLDNPMVIYLHAGPGLSEMGMSRNFNAKLEDYYTMVYLDQRGGGKSYSLFLDAESISTGQLIEDIHDLTLYLKKRFGKKKIVIMGHSFGAGFATLAAAQYPEDYSLCIGIGQPVCPVECDKRSYPYVLDLARKEGNEKAVRELETIEGFWLSRDKNVYFSRMMIFKKWVGYYGGQIFGKTGFVGYYFRNSLCSEVTIFDYPAILLGMSFSGPASWEIMISTDLRKQASTLNMPFIIIEGRHDINTFPPFVEEYFSMVKAPYKKLYWFEKSAHFPNTEESGLFQKIMIEDILPMARSK